MAKNFVEQITIKAVAEGFDKIQQNLEKFGKSADQLSKKFESLGNSLSLKVTAPLAALGGLAVNEFLKAEKAVAKVENQLRLTGSRIGITFDELDAASKNLQKNSIFGDDEILSTVSAQLLRVGTLTKDNFFQAQQAVIDLASKLDGDLSGAAAIVTRALERPSEALGALEKQGIIFSSSQTKVIQRLVETGKSSEAAEIILNNLTTATDGSAKALAATSFGALKQFQESLSNLAETIGEVLVPILKPFVDRLKSILDSLQDTNPKVLEFSVKLGILAASVGPVLLAFSKFKDLMQGIFTKTGLIGLAIAGLFALAEAFDGFKNLGLSVAIVINEAFLKLIDTVLKIPTAVAILIPALGVIKLTASSIRDTIQQSIDDLNKSLNSNILAQQSEKFGEKAGKATADGYNKSLTDGIAKGDEIRKKFLLEADAELARERAEKLNSLPNAFEGSVNIPSDAAQNASEIEGQLTPAISKFSEFKEEVIELTQVGQIFTNSLTSGFSNIISGTETLSQGFKNMGKNLLNALTNASLNAAFSNLFKNLGGIFSTATPQANGGPIGKFATGGAVSGPGGPKSDSIPAWLSNGEYVINAKSASMLGLNLLNKLNSLGKGFSPRSRFGLPAFADGGAVAGSSGVSVNVINNSSQPVNARASTRFDGRQLIIDTFLEDARNNGPMSQNIQNLYGVRR